MTITEVAETELAIGLDHPDPKVITPLAAYVIAQRHLSDLRNKNA